MGDQLSRATRRDLLKIAAVTGVGIGSVALSDRQAVPVAAAASGDPIYDVKLDFGAHGDGSTDDTASIQAALDAARQAGGGTVYLPPGTYMVSTANRQGGLPQGFQWATALMVGASTRVVGAGRNASVIRLNANQPGTSALGSVGAAMITPWNVNQEHLSFNDFTLDGNAANQTDKHCGMFIWRQRWVTMHRVRVQDCHGISTNGGPDETALFLSQEGADYTFEACQAIQTGSATCSSGFTAGEMTNIKFSCCTAVAIGQGGSPSFGFGFNANDGHGIQYVGCEACLCGQEGFHVDNPKANQVHYIGCIAGATATGSSNQYPFASGQNLGNQYGFACSVAATQVHYIGCSANGNSQHGFIFQGGASGVQMIGCTADGNASCGLSSAASSVRIVGGAFTNNQFGLFFNGASDATTVVVSGGTIVSGNTSRNLSIAGVTYNPPGNVAAPSLPASGTALVNPFPYDAQVFLAAGASLCAVTIDGIATGLTVAASTAQMVRLRAGATIALTYSSAPSWKWWID